MDEDTVLRIPLVFTGIPGGSILKIDCAVARLAEPNATRGMIITAAGDSDAFEVANDGQSPSESETIYELLHVRGIPDMRLNDKPVMLQLNYSATLLNLLTPTENPAYTHTKPGLPLPSHYGQRCHPNTALKEIGGPRV